MTYSHPKYRLIALPEEHSIEEIELFNGKLEALIAENSNPIIINCERVEMIYSAGLSVMIDAYKRCNRAKIVYAVVNINSSIMSLLHSTKLNKVLNLYATQEEYEISEFEDGIVGTKVPPLDFSYEEADVIGAKLLNCKGVMCEGPTMTQMLQSIQSTSTIIFNLTHLSFMDADVLDDFIQICAKKELWVFGANDIILDEFRLFRIEDALKIRASLEEIRKEMNMAKFNK